MAVHKANLDRLAATGIPIEITELDLDGLAVNGVPGDEMQLALLPQRRPDLLGAPARRGHHAVGLAGAEPLAQRPERADRRSPTGRSSPPAHWLFNYVNGDRAGDPARPELHDRRRQREPRSARSQADDWASQMDRPNLRTFKWRITGGIGDGIFAFDAGHGRAARRRPAAARREHDLLAEGARQRRLPRERRGRRDRRHRGPRERRRRRRRRDRARHACR